MADKADNTTKSSAMALLIAWVFVGVPLGWGVYNTALNAMKLFQPAPATTAAPAAASPATSPGSGAMPK
jgi:hypothetical protein